MSAEDVQDDSPEVGRSHPTPCDFSRNTRRLLLALMTVLLTAVGWCLKTVASNGDQLDAFAKEAIEVRVGMVDELSALRTRQESIGDDVSTIKQDVKAMLRNGGPPRQP